MKKLVAVNERGRVIGQNHPRAKLLDWEVDQVLELVEGGFSLSQVADKMGMSKSGVQKIVNGSRRCQVAANYKTVSVSDGE